ncbi:hypothetical protein F3157_03330 [Virgibacillus dakarensis]|uniref:Endospore coat-associated protein YutH n=1 Tax=Lentibacillus populi TaxID=1827502 RepID=A0A9W5TVT8_9BACI|nr:hypothetical protein [Lentibacillus populi]MBT2217094.1 hypothetical protein [Virgibacillus dakarensis]MTW84690.1 hypothetical protein [Virgibacillus dakarensis]GGB36590.1 endospore coat-associated protein YutH [Lentibacillus populi]
MQDLLATYYDIQTEGTVMLDNRYGNKNGEYIYFIISADNKEAIHMEQAALAYYLAENNYHHTALPIQTRHGDWFLEYQGKHYLVLQVNLLGERNPSSPGRQLAEFHELGATYRYEPQKISSYGQWKQLWINKLTGFEKKLSQEAEEHPCDYYRRVKDAFPYIIGLSENAIQYVQETEQEYRFDNADQGTIAFKRYQDSITKPVIWTDRLVYDHPVRDLAEHVRYLFLQDGNKKNDLNLFLHDYQSIRPLSVFSWRLLYARLIFPIHLFDVLERGFNQEDSDLLDQELTHLLAKQTVYEKRLGEFFDDLGIDHQGLQIPVLHWV